MPISEDISASGDTKTFGAALAAFRSAAPGELMAAYWPLAESVWQDGAARPGAAAATPELVAALDPADPRRAALVAILLGLLADSEEAAVGEHLGSYLDLLTTGAADEGLRSALLFLVGKFPADRERVLTVASGLGLDKHEASRLERCLATIDPDDEIGVLQAGRTFPAPTVWDVADEDLKQAGGWASWIGLDRDAVSAMWAMDTGALRAYESGRALWLAAGGTLRPYDPAGTVVSEPEPGPVDWRAAVVRLGAALCCPTCRGPLTITDTAAECGTCEKVYAAGHDAVDFIEDIPDIYDPFVLPAYGRGIREAYLRVIGRNWGAAMTAAEEDEFLAGQTHAEEGPVLDIGPDNGKSTKQLVERFGTGRVIVLDQSGPMLRFLRGRWPELFTVRAMCYTMPFTDHSLGAVNCWNVWQGASDKESLLAEVARCLRPGGTMTFLAYRAGRDPISRHLQQQLNIKTMDLFEPDELRGFLDKNGFTISGYAERGENLMLVAATLRQR